MTPLFLLLLAAQPAWSQGTIYFDRTTFSNACQSVSGIKQGISFEYLPGGPEFGPVLTVSDVTFRGRYLIRHSPSSLFNFDSDIPLTMHFNMGALAFGADFASELSPQFSSSTATLSLDNGEKLNFTAPSDPSSQFFGFIFPTPIMDLTFSDGGIFISGSYPFHEEVIGNPYMVLSVPEPGVFGLFTLGTLLLGWRFLCKLP